MFANSPNWVFFHAFSCRVIPKEATATQKSKSSTESMVVSIVEINSGDDPVNWFPKMKMFDCTEFEFGLARKSIYIYWNKHWIAKSHCVECIICHITNLSEMIRAQLFECLTFCMCAEWQINWLIESRIKWLHNGAIKGKPSLSKALSGSKLSAPIFILFSEISRKQPIKIEIRDQTTNSIWKSYEQVTHTCQ